MSDMGLFLKTFFSNISIMLTLMYVASLIYKYTLYKLSPNVKEILFILLAILCGLTTMHYGFQFSETALFDLRFMAIIVAPMFVRHPISILIIGLGIGAARLSFGLSYASFVGCCNVIVMSLLCMLICWWAEQRNWGFYRKMTALVLWINTANVVIIAVFGVIPSSEYLLEIAPGTYILSLILSFGFTLLLREFIMEANRKWQLHNYNIKLKEQYHISEEKTKELQLAKLELEEKNEQILLASRYKSAFLANMSHELRTPLNSILVLSQILEENIDGQLSDEEIRYANIIHSSGEELLHLINEVLDLSKIEAGRMDLDRSEFSISETLEQMSYTFQPIAMQKNIELVIESKEGVPAIIYADGQRLQQIIKNLLSNAMKFTEKGTVKLSVYPIRDKKGIVNGTELMADWLVFSVEDSGIGISETKQPIIFEAFYQADDTISRKYGGTGLGLSISKQFAALMGGFIELESQEGLGSKFSLYVPWEEITQSQGSEEACAREEAYVKQEPPII
ncbi:sensor histidine kinase [Paenibacillus eucommiae]|uniref:histidine kinase n=1 Tax=Paenibacillus eucommiae TaxID=1355755 RepID=A0ABS4JD82_9BACL|nr:ATP-binding protein [Paenibacillus eucommiae]MBP1997046.1 two-component system chemotaxis sensor kinase CheA [Paenibacillus eucommiae]